MSDGKKYKVTPPTGQGVNAEGVIVTNNPVGNQRKWVKLWCDPWLKGTTRYVNTDAECAFWIDLLAEAGGSRFAGYICPGQENGQLIGYPLAWYQRLRPAVDVMATFDKFAGQSKIAYNITCENPLSIVVQILNWDKYQSPIDDATRAKNYRNSKKKQ